MWSHSTVDARATVEQRVSICTCVLVKQTNAVFVLLY